MTLDRARDFPSGFTLNNKLALVSVTGERNRYAYRRKVSIVRRRLWGSILFVFSIEGGGAQCDLQRLRPDLDTTNERHNGSLSVYRLTPS